MKRFLQYCIVMGVTCFLSCVALAQHKLNGAGSSFIYPLMTQWTASYYKNTQVKINYQPIGSGGGITQLSNKTINFAASDMPLTSAQLKSKTPQWQQFPAAMGAIVMVVNLQGIKNNQLTLSGPLLAAIYQGQIKKWNDPRLRKLNPKLKLPNTAIILVARADSSGTTYNFTHYLSQVSSSWKQQTGFSTNIKWPSYVLGAKGNAGVASQVMNMPASLGYVEYAYAKQNNMTMLAMQNRAGKLVTANSASFNAAAENANWSQAAQQGFHLMLTNQPGAGSWPMLATTYVLLATPANQQQLSVNRQLMRFFNWVFTSPQAVMQAKQLDYVPLPKSLVELINHQTAIHHHTHSKAQD